MKDQAHYLQSFQESIFAQMSALAKTHHAVNVGQGFPDFDGPDFAIEAYRQALTLKQNQYAPHPGLAELRSLIAQTYKSYYSLDYDPETEISVSTGATEAIYTTISCLLNVGDEVVLFEPFYDSYLATVQMRGGVPRFVTLGGDDFTFTEKDLRAAFTAKTKLVILNSPHNPTGKVFSMEEMSWIAKLVEEHDAYVLSDEVYEHLVYDGYHHTPFATLPGMQERTFTISSAGKTFGVTGWKVGWCCAPEHLSKAFRLTRQFITFSVNTPAQLATQKSLELLSSYLPTFQQTYLEKRNMVLQGLADLGMRTYRPVGTYFIMVNLKGKTQLSDVDYCFHMIKEKKVAMIPPSVFYRKSNEGKHWVRFCFAKKQETLQAALQGLSQ